MSSLIPLVAAAQTQSSGTSLFPLLLIIVVVGLFFFMSRGQRRQRQRTAQLQRSLVPGQDVMTGSGIYGTVVSVVDDRVQIEVAPGTVMTVAKQAITRTVESADMTAPTVVDPTADESTQARVAD